MQKVIMVYFFVVDMEKAWKGNLCPYQECGYKTNNVEVRMQHLFASHDELYYLCKPCFGKGVLVLVTSREELQKHLYGDKHEKVCRGCHFLTVDNISPEEEFINMEDDQMVTFDVVPNSEREKGKTKVVSTKLKYLVASVGKIMYETGGGSEKLLQMLNKRESDQMLHRMNEDPYFLQAKCEDYRQKLAEEEGKDRQEQERGERKKKKKKKDRRHKRDSSSRRRESSSEGKKKV